MTLRAIVQDGRIVVNTNGAIADGTLVEISVARRRRSRSAGPTASAFAKPSGRKSAPSKGTTTITTTRIPGFGMWADRADLGDADGAVERLRAVTRRRRIA